MLKQRSVKFVRFFLVKTLSLVIFCPLVTFAQIFDGHTLKKVSEADILKRVGPGTIVVFGEVHDSEAHHQNQRDLLVKMSGASWPISVGMEFIDYTDQAYLDSFLNQTISEEVFLEKIKWGGIPFVHYRFQVKLPPYLGGWTFGLNIPRRITAKVGQSGLESLSPQESALLPPQFELGTQAYFERFKEVMKGHVPPQKIQNYFVAQSLWDDTMAWQAIHSFQKYPNQTLVIMVGDFHAAYYGGLPDRLAKRSTHPLVVISQVHSLDEVAIHPKYGPRADFIWVAASPLVSQTR